jgi:hypothetical protein
MISLLTNIWHGVLSIPYLIADFLVMVLNGLIAAIGALAAAVLSLLPSFPDTPDAPDSGVLGFLNWVVPLGPMIASFAILIAAWTSFLVIKIALKWVKAL